ncbi:MAG: succinylglutamate desuccinylase/aspartoacylase family protein [Inquilinus limosus]|uniref:Succinylglutamate desuccinylase/aspartoacylase family protein n=1 Tax=Inquilinus limosus TaxID=171674 RepID=A0A952KCR6_9PROT|nr:succinylglutamate desuccinylase/aspartoacylase family protein [Inquilinus limosus]
MDRSWDVIPGDMPGLEWRIPVLRFRGRGGGPSAYLQAALHAEELPGVVALDALCARLRRAEAAGDIRGDITIVPWANPIGQQQWLHGSGQGRYDFDSRVNFNRGFPRLGRPDPALLPGDDVAVTATERLKARLLRLALPCEIVLDLHCDDESPLYLYITTALWPAMTDLAAAMRADTVLLWDGDGGGAFDDACLTPWLRSGDLAGRAVSTVELRGMADVDAGLADSDADGLFRFLAGRGVIAGDAGPMRDWSGPAVPLNRVEMIKAPAGGAIAFARKPGDRVEAGDLLATILVRPGEEGGGVPVRAPQAGVVLTRRVHRRTRPGDDLMKLACGSPSATARPGPLEP